MGEIRVRRRNNVELFDVDGKRHPRPTREERLAIYVERNAPPAEPEDDATL